MAQPTAIDLEYVVREVVRRLRQIEQHGAAPPQAAGELAVADRVITLRTLADRLSGVKRIIAPRGAVITPAARDELKARNIAIGFAAAAPNNHTLGRGMILAVCGGPLRAEDLAKNTGSAPPARTMEHNDMPTMIENLDSAISGRQKIALLATDQPAAALLLANRRRGLRAALAGAEPEVDENTAAIGANLLVVDCRGRSELEIGGLARRFAAVASSVCPPQIASG